MHCSTSCMAAHQGPSPGNYSDRLTANKLHQCTIKCSQPITCSDFSSLYQTLSLAIDLKLHVNPGPSKNDGPLYH